MSSTDKCFACDRKLLSRRHKADTRDDQIVDVGPDCYKLIKAAGDAGYQPPKGGPRLYSPNCRRCEGRGWYLKRFSDNHRTVCNHTHS